MLMYPWKHYDIPVYWHLPDDGDSFTCTNCKEKFPHNEVILTQISTNDSRATICKSCIDPYWLGIAKDLGMFPG